MRNRNWTTIQVPLYPWVSTIDRILCAQKLPSMLGSVVNVFSDYSGDHKGSKYNVISALYLDLEASKEWEYERRIVRSQYLSDGRRISFKKLGDRQRQQALVPFLEAADRIVGVNVTLAIRKSIQHLCVTEEEYKSFQENLTFESKWEHNSFDKMLQVVHLISLLVGGLSHHNQHIYWISDQDQLFANDKRANDLRQMLARYSSHYVKHPLGELGLGTTALDEGDRFEEDLAAIPDLAAGAVAEITTTLSIAAGGKIPTGVAMPFSGKFTPKTEVLSSWLADQSQSLKRIVILFEKGDGDRYSVSKLDMS